VYDPTGLYQKPVHVTLYLLSAFNGSVDASVTTKFEWSATAAFLQNQTVLDPFPPLSPTPLWLDGAGVTGTIGNYAGQPGVPGGRLLLVNANNTSA
jgi:hypothetical protein